VVTGAPTWSASVEGLFLSRQGFVVKYRAADGAPLWIQKLGTMGYSVTLDMGGNAYLAGRFTGTSTFGSTSNLVSAGGNDAFLVKFGVLPPQLALTQTNLLVIAGSNTTLQVTGAVGTGPLAYQWQLNGANLAGMTGSSLTLTNFSPASAGRYSVVAQNTSGSVTGYVGALGLIPVLSAAPVSNGVALRWDGTFTLQSATNVTGPYADLLPAASPYTNFFDPDEPSRFFRLRVGNPTVTGVMLTNQWFVITVAGSPGHIYRIEASTNLMDWRSVTTDASPFSIVNTTVSESPQCFYRAMLAP